MNIPGYISMAQFAKVNQISYETVLGHMKKGYCHWPRRTNTENLQNHPYYTMWNSLVQRCTNPKAAHYASYGGRGINVHPTWRESRVFLQYCDEVLGQKPQGYSLDRIDNNKGYEPGNIRWASSWAQQTNQRRQRNNRSKFTGLYYDKDRDCWVISINRCNINIIRKRYKTYSDAITALVGIRQLLWQYGLLRNN